MSHPFPDDAKLLHLLAFDIESLDVDKTERYHEVDPAMLDLK